jgi:hypothetical protein
MIRSEFDPVLWNRGADVRKYKSWPNNVGRLPFLPSLSDRSQISSVQLGLTSLMMRSEGSHHTRGGRIDWFILI